MTLKSINPHDQSEVGELSVATAGEIKAAVDKAKKASPSWKETPITTRVGYIKKFKKLLSENKQVIAKLVTKEMGKPLSQSLSDVDCELEFINYYINNGPKFLADETVHKSATENFRIVYEPYGVCACIAPWNFPISMITSGVVPALIAGNTVVAKPSEYCSLSQKMVVDLLNQTGLPVNTLLLLIGNGTVGKMLLEEPIDLVWFTGSTKVGQEIYAKCGQKFIKSLLEMGGSSPAIVFADADLDNALENLYWSRFLNAGQVCTAVKRLYVEKPIFDKFVKMFIDRLKAVKVGDPLIGGNDIGPLVSTKQLEILNAQFEDAVSKGAKVEIGGPLGESQKGNYFNPTILTNIKNNMRILTEEVFGPILPIMPFKTNDEVIEAANNSVYGLSAEIYTADLIKAEQVSKRLAVGSVAINTDNFFKPECPFGGYKKSGIGREYGELGMKEFSQVKLIAVT